MPPKITCEQQIKLSLYQQEILRWNKTTNLIGRSTIKNFEQEHILNSLEILPYLDGDLPLIDIGTGGGIPGIPLAIMLPQREIILTEIDKKKLAFLHYITAKLTLLNTKVVEVFPHTIFEKNYDIVSRAYGSISRILAWTEKHVPYVHRYYLLKGVSAEKELTEAGISDFSLVPLTKGCLVMFPSVED